jgi:hypothetical protein
MYELLYNIFVMFQLIAALIANMVVLYQLKINERSVELKEILNFGGGDIL